MKEIKLYYKYPGYARIEYDRTRNEKWARVQLDRMKKDFPGAEYMVEPQLKESPKKKELA